MPIITTGIAAASAASFATAAASTAAVASTSAAVVAGGALVAGAAFVYPRLQPDPPDLEGQRLDDTRLMTRSASEGAFINECFGHQNRMAGNIIYISNLEEQKLTEEIEVGKDAVQTATSYRYFITILVGLCQGNIQDVRRVWANGKIIYQSFLATEIESNLIDAERIALFDIFGIALKLKSPPGGPDLSQVVIGGITIVTGFPIGAEFLNNSIGSICILSAMELDGSSWCIVVNPFAADFDNDGSHTISISQLNLFFLPFRALAMDIQTGGPLQLPHPSLLLYSFLNFSPALHPAYRNISSFMITRLWLQEFGNSVPTFSFEVKKDVTCTAAEAISRILQSAGLSTDDFDVTEVSGTIKGYTISGVQSAIQALRPLMRAFDIISQEVNGKLRFFNRGEETTYSVNEVDLTASMDGEPSPRKLTILDVSGVDLPSNVTVGYLDPEIDFQRASQTERRINNVTNNNVVIDLPMVLSSVEARFIARRELWTAWRNRQVLTFTLPPRYSLVQEGDALLVTSSGITYRVLVTKIDRGNNFLLAIEALVEDAIVIPDGESDGAPSGDDLTFFPPFLLLTIADLPPLQSSTTTVPGAYFAITALDPSAFWGGARLYRSIDGTTFNNIQGVPTESSFGLADTEIGSGPVGYWDNVSTVDVTMLDGALSSRTALEVLNGSNLALLGKEIISFRNVEVLGARQYRLSGLLRGLRNTESRINFHASGEIFLPLFSSNLGFISINSGVIDTVRYYKAVANNADEADATIIEHEHKGNTIRPFAPTHMTGSRDGSNNLTLSWVRRTRDLIRFFAFLDPALLEDDEEYEIDFLLSSVVVRTVTVSGATTYVYSAANQSSDGITPGDPIEVEIYQMSSYGFRGNRLRATI